MTGEEAERAAFSGDGVLYEFGEACPLRVRVHGRAPLLLLLRCEKVL